MDGNPDDAFTLKPPVDVYQGIREGKKTYKARTFENNCIIQNIDVDKNSLSLCSVNKHLACMVRVISEDADSLMTRKSLDRIHSEITPEFLR